MLIRALTRTLNQALDPTFRSVILKSTLITILIYGLLTVLFYWLRPDVQYFDADGLA